MYFTLILHFGAEKFIWILIL